MCIGTRFYDDDDDDNNNAHVQKKKSPFSQKRDIGVTYIWTTQSLT